MNTSFLPIVGLIALFVAGGLRAQDLELDRFDTEDGAWAWTKWWGANETEISFDAAQDAAGSATSGALKVVSAFDLAAYGGDNQFSLQRDLPEGGTVSGAGYLRMEMDLKVDPSSPKRPGGDHGYLEFGVRFADFTQSYFGTYTIPAGDGSWRHLQADIPINHEKIETITGITIKLWSGGAEDGLTGTMTFWVDNLVLIANPDALDFGPPALEIAQATPGLTIFANGAGQYDRQNLRTTGTRYSWVDRPGPVAWSITIAEHPPVGEWQTHLFLVPGADQPATLTAPDWDLPDVVFVHIGSNADGTGYLSFRYKKDQPSANGMFFNADPESGPVGALGGVGSAHLTGTWTVRFLNDTDVELTSSDGTSNTIIFPEADVPRFAGDMRAYVGTQPNTADNINHRMIISRIQVTGSEADFDETFGAPLDTGLLEVNAANPGGVVVVTPDGPCWLTWSLPAPGWTPQSAADLKTWLDPLFPAPALTVGDIRWQLATVRSEFPPNSNAFYRLHRPETDQ